MEHRHSRGRSNICAVGQEVVVVLGAPWVAVAEVAVVVDAPPGSIPTTTSKALRGGVALEGAQTLEDHPTLGATPSLVHMPLRDPLSHMGRCLLRGMEPPHMVDTSKPLHLLDMHRRPRLLQCLRPSMGSRRLHRRIQDMLTRMRDTLHLLQQLQLPRWGMEVNRLMHSSQLPPKPTTMLLKLQ